MKNRTQNISVDVMKGDKFICTLRYPRPPLYPLFPVDFGDLQSFVFSKRPTLRHEEDLIYYIS